MASRPASRFTWTRILLAIAIAASGVKLYGVAVTPVAGLLGRIAAEPLDRIFEGQFTYRAPLLLPTADRIEVHSLRLPRLPDPEGRPTAGGPGLTAERVVIEHDPLALASLHFHPERIQIEGAHVATRETESGVDVDFPLDLGSEEPGEHRLPGIEIRDARVVYRAQKDSKRLRSSSVLVLAIDHLSVLPRAGADTRVTGTLHTLGLGQDTSPITVQGRVSPEGDAFSVEIRWDQLFPTEELLSVLNEDHAAPLRTRSFRHGTLVLKLTQDPRNGDGALTPIVQWTSELTPEGISTLPGLQSIDATTRQQIEDLFSNSVLQVELAEGRLDVKSLVTDLAGGRAQISGWVDPETGALQLEFTVRDLRLEDPGLAKALGPDAASVFAEFDARGLVDAVGTLERAPGGELAWSVDVLLEGASLRYVGRPDATGRRVGFPYPMDDASGRIRIRPDGLYFDEIVGFHRRAELSIRGHAQRGWTGIETGIVRFTEQDPDVRLTVEAINVPVDETLLAAIQGSDFAEILEDIELAGVIDRVEVDLVQISGVDAKVRPDVRITLGGEEFVYKPFPLRVEDVRGSITLRHPLTDGQRGKTWAWSVTGWAEGAPLRIDAELREKEGRGRIVVRAEGIPLAGGLTDAVLASPLTGEELAEVWRWLAPRGRARVVADLPMGEDPGASRFEAELLGASIQLDAEGDPHPIEFSQIEGVLRVSAGEVLLDELRGRLAGSPARVQGRISGGSDGEWELQVHVQDLKLERNLMDSLAHLADGALLPGGMRVATGSRMALGLKLHRNSGEEGTLQAVINAHDLDATLNFADGNTLHIEGGPLHVEEGEIQAQSLTVSAPGLVLRAEHARLRIDDDARPKAHAGSALTGTFHLKMQNLELHDGLLELLPEGARPLISDLTRDRLLVSEGLLVDAPAQGPTSLQGDLAFVVKEGAEIGEGPRGRVILEPLVIDEADETHTALSGSVRFEGFSIDVGASVEDVTGRLVVDALELGTRRRAKGRLEDIGARIAGFRVRGLAAPVDWSDEVLTLHPIQGQLSGGRLQGRLQVHTAEPGAYEAEFRVDDLDIALLGEDLSPSGTEYRGKANLEATLRNPSGTVRDLRAVGKLHIREGDLGDLPFVANVLALGAQVLNSPDRPRFERADVDFELTDELVLLRRLELAGPLFTMHGNGTIDLEGVADLTLRPDFIKSLLLPGVMQIPIVGDVLGGVLREDLLYAVRVRGDLNTARPELVLLPPLGLDRGKVFEGGGVGEYPERRLPSQFR